MKSCSEDNAGTSPQCPELIGSTTSSYGATQHIPMKSGYNEMSQPCYANPATGTDMCYMYDFTGKDYTENANYVQGCSTNSYAKSGFLSGTATESQRNAGTSGKRGPEIRTKRKTVLRTAGGEAWEDPTLLEWDFNDFRMFCGDLGNDVTDDVLSKAFSKYPSFLKAKVIRDKRTNKTRGFGFISFKDHNDFSKAMKEMNGKYVGSRPIKLRKSNWKLRTIDQKALKKLQSSRQFLKTPKR